MSGTRTLLALCGLIALLGGVIGILLGCGFLEILHIAMTQLFPVSVLEMLGPWLGYMMILAAGIGFISGIVPATRAAELSVVDGLRRVV